MNLYDYLFRYHCPVKKAVVNLEVIGVTYIAITKNYYTGFADTVPTL